MEKLEIIQYQAALAIPGARQGSTRSKIVVDVGAHFRFTKLLIIVLSRI